MCSGLVTPATGNPAGCYRLVWSFALRNSMGVLRTPNVNAKREWGEKGVGECVELGTLNPAPLRMLRVRRGAIEFRSTKLVGISSRWDVQVEGHLRVRLRELLVHELSSESRFLRDNS